MDAFAETVLGEVTAVFPALSVAFEKMVYEPAAGMFQP
jgi:hypothetical protein